MSEQEQEQLPDVAPVQTTDDDDASTTGGGTPSTPDPSSVAGREHDDPELRAWLQHDGDQLRDRELRDGDKLSDSTVGCWAVYDNHELRFWPGLRVRDTREQAQADLDEVRPTTGHDLVVVEV